MPDDHGSTSPDQTPDVSAPRRPAPTDTLVQDGFPLIAHDPGAPDPPAGYELLGVVGRGGMGVVYRARHLALIRDVAIKILHDRYPPDGPAARQFVEEAHITAQLVHPGIPPIHEVGTMPDGRPYVAMKLVVGGARSTFSSPGTRRAAG